MQLTPRGREIVDAARDLLDREGPDALTMRRLAESLGIRAPSLYKHLPDKDALEAAVISLAFEEFGDALAAATEHADDRLWALAVAYRGFALDHPHLYRLMTGRPLRRDLLAPGSEQRGSRALDDATGGDADLGRALWAFAHGMTVLELDDRFPRSADLDAAWRRGVDSFRAGVARPRTGERS
ncbi:TetR family transcriptional regulator [Actinoplanes philippinensis]|nr:TetR/AcrR family transcriptional regulator [Actinoplanes philippinensis]GIE82495.1 TetR family transcriptional regulator [Actinoplanes philippinensis]